MGNRSRKLELVHDAEPVGLGELIHDAVRVAIERIVREELEAELGAAPYERAEIRHGYRNGTRHRTLAGPTGPLAEGPLVTLGGALREHLNQSQRLLRSHRCKTGTERVPPGEWSRLD